MNKKLKNFLLEAWWVVTSPFRLLFNIAAFPFRLFKRFRQFMNTEPEERPLNEVFENLATKQETRNSLFDHLFALRFHMLRVVVAFAFFCLVSLYYLTDIMTLLQMPLAAIGEVGLRISGPGDIFDLIPKIVFASASVLTAPYLIFEFYLFAAPGLRPLERKLGLFLQFIFLVFSVLTLAIGFYIILPASLLPALKLTEMYGIYDWELSRYLSFTMEILILSALIVYYPFAIFLYIAKYRKPRIPYRIIILISFLLAATITPGTMILIDAGLTVILSLIYIPTYLAIMVLYRAPKQSSA